MKLNKKEKQILVELEPVLLTIQSLRSELAFYEAKRSAIENELQSINPKKINAGSAFFGGVEVYQYKRRSTAYKKAINDLAVRYQLDPVVVGQIINENTKINETIKTRLGGLK